jgi:hypothetical protein
MEGRNFAGGGNFGGPIRFNVPGARQKATGSDGVWNCEFPFKPPEGKQVYCAASLQSNGNTGS